MPNNYNNIGRLRPDKSDLDEALEVAWISLKKIKRQMIKLVSLGTITILDRY
jgi:hypothetical protein